MSEQRFFRVEPAPYDEWRLWLENELGRPTLEPLENAQRAQDGDVLLGVWAFHCDVPACAEAIATMLAEGWGQEINEQQFRDLLPPEIIH